MAHALVGRRISILVPVFNEEDVLDVFYRRVSASLDGIGHVTWSFIFVDDGSADSSFARISDLCRADSRCSAIKLSRNFGKEAALTAAIDHADGDAVIIMDADLQDPPELIAPMVDAWEKGAKVVLAKRVDRRDDSFLKRVTASVFYSIHNHISALKLPDNVGDCRLMDRVVVESVRRLPERQRFMKGVFAWVGFQSVYLEYKRPSRVLGVSKFSGWRLWNFALEGITSFSTLPLRVWTYLGGAIACAAMAYALFILLRTILRGIDVPGYASLIVLILFLGGIQLIGIGVLGEYLGRVYMEVKQRPIYVVERLEGGKR
jgi:glycosyltransferase involved in cell wall biosynthesis